MQPSRLDPRDESAPAARILSNGNSVVLVTAAGTGFSTYGDHLLGHWDGDRVADHDGFFIYWRDVGNDVVWSAAPAPMRPPASWSRMGWEPGRCEFAGRHVEIETTLDIAVLPDAPVEVRRLRLVNRSTRRRQIEITSFLEIALADRAAHAAHPAFSKLFVQTEYVADAGAILARRRARAPDDRHPVLFHAAVGARVAEWETDRARFIGRGGSVAAPQAMHGRLAGTCGSVLDPCASLRCVMVLEPEGQAEVAFLLGGATDRAAALRTMASISDPRAVDAAFESAREAAQTTLDRLGIDRAAAEAFESLAGAMLYRHPALRASPEVLARAQGNHADLERLGIASRRPFALLGAEHASLLPEVLRALRTWRSLGLGIDLVIVRGDAVFATEFEGLDPEPRVLHASNLDASDLDLLQTHAHFVIRGALQRIAQELQTPAPVVTNSVQTESHLFSQGAKGRATGDTSHENSVRTELPASEHRTPTPPAAAGPVASDRDLQYFNGVGGFSSDGREYVMHLHCGVDGRLALPPRPWINVLANARLGCITSETGAGFTWCENSREHRLTPWANDPLLDPHSEALYLRDDATGEFWSPLPGPAPAAADYEVRHGLGSSTVRHTSHGLAQEVALFVPRHDPVKIVALRITNHSAQERRLSYFAYAQLVLGGIPADASRFVVTTIEDGTVFARNRFAEEFAGGVGFGAVVMPVVTEAHHVSADREGFLGRSGSVASPAALRDAVPLDGRAGAGLDPCVAHQVQIDLPPGASCGIAFLLGEGRDATEARDVVRRYRVPGAITQALADVHAFWRTGVEQVQITTPSRALDLMVNAWLPYQTLACRLWARSALYQSGGAFGFRDQLQDAAALVHLWPERLRAQILLHAAHQFLEGDVLHWWHPPLARGIRTRFADDLLWLPYLTADYVRTTGDRAVLDEQVSFVTARALAPDEDEAYLVPERSAETSDVYEHCCRALDRALGLGIHGLPLFGSGDWNDGMNRVGREGRGESVWMGFFLYTVLGDFAPLCDRRGDEPRARRYRAHRERLRAALETTGWDGGWYRRGYYDDGTPLGSQASDECRIDALVQAWSVISGAAPRARAGQAMDAVERELISDADGLVRLLTPPFDATPHDPGYIKGYVPGVRENGGQYTHAALWVVRALAELGRNDRALQVLEMLTPIHHTRTPAEVAVYQVEPYVVAADVYGAPPHVGRGGWTWYTGSSGWMIRVALESILGLRLEHGEFLCLTPCVPDDWPEFTIRLQVPGDATRYEIVARNPHRSGLGVREARLDGVAVPVDNGVIRVPLRRDGGVHRIEIILGREMEAGA